MSSSACLQCPRRVRRRRSTEIRPSSVGLRASCAVAHASADRVALVSGVRSSTTYSILPASRLATGAVHIRRVCRSRRARLHRRPPANCKFSTMPPSYSRKYYFHIMQIIINPCRATTIVIFNARIVLTGKRNVTVWRSFVRLSVPSAYSP